MRLETTAEIATTVVPSSRSVGGVLSSYCPRTPSSNQATVDWPFGTAMALRTEASFESRVADCVIANAAEAGAEISDASNNAAAVTHPNTDLYTLIL